MSQPTMPRLPRTGRGRDALSVSEDTPPGGAALDHERATSGAVNAMDASAEAPAEMIETDEMRKQRTRRVATIIAVLLIVSAIVSGAAAALARRAQQRASASSASSASSAQAGQG